MKKVYKAPNKELEEKLSITLHAIGDQLYSLRKEQKASLKKVAKAIRMSPALISQMEQGLQDFKLMHLVRLCRYYKVEVADIMERAWPPSPQAE